MHTRVIYDRVQNKKINFEIPAIFERRGFQINFPVPYPIIIGAKLGGSGGSAAPAVFLVS